MLKFTLLRSFLAGMMILFAPLTLTAQELPGSSSVVMQVDINTADAQTLAETLVGVGMVRAKEIVAYREMFGKFRSIDELTAVQGIGAATVEKNRHLIMAVDNQ